MDQTLIYSWYEQYKNGIYRYIFSITKDAHLSEDILHDTFLKLLTGKYTVSPEKIRPWLYRVARNLCFDHMRKRKRECVEETMADTGPNPFRYIEMLASLSPLEQEIVSLKIIGGLTHREIGIVLGISPEAAQKRYERAIAALRKEEDHYGT